MPKPVPDTPAPLADALRDRYALERELGRGGMATVYLARDLRHARQVALKVLRPELAALFGRERFLREIRLTAGLDHPHILPVLDSADPELPEQPLWYTMPLVKGESLRDRLRREGRLPLAEAVRLTLEVADALAYAHRHGVVHRDVKPENILLSENHARVADFGIARAAESAGGDGRLTGTGFIVGTPAYMSPEQSVGGEVDARTDVYALACVTYELLAGAPPHGGPTPQAIITHRYREPFPSLRSRRPDLPPALEEVLGRALATDPADRYETTEAYAEALSAAAAGAGPARAGRPPLAAAAAIALAGGVVALGLRQLGRTSEPTAADAVRIAVLPFENLGDSSRAYLTDGLADGVRGRLAAVPALQVISSGSTEPYRRSRKPLREIGRELEVPYLLTARVRWIASTGGEPRMQVSPELVQAATGATRWQNPMQAGAAGASELPAAIAQAIVDALGVPVTPTARTVLGDTARASPEAYDLYLRASSLLRQYSMFQAPGSVVAPAIALLRRAIAIDTAFALAKVRLARALRAAGSMSGGDTLRYAEADSLLGAVLAQQPTMAEALAARGALREDRMELDQALRLYQEAAALEPSNAEVQGSITFIQSLRLDTAALATGARAVALAPRDADMLRRVIAGTVIFRNADQLERYSDRLIELEPRDPLGYLHKALVHLWAGDTAAAVGLLQRSETVLGSTAEVIGWIYAMSGPAGWRRWHDLRLDDLASAEGRDTLDFYWNKGQIAGAEGRRLAERAYADSLYGAAVRVRRTDPFYPLAVVQLAWARAVRGDAAAPAAVVEADSVLRSAGPGYEFFFQYVAAAAYAAAGDTTRAIAATRLLLEHPSAYNRATVRTAPEFWRLRGVPTFERLLADAKLP
jgi:serine/threonine-protein kinase